MYLGEGLYWAQKLAPVNSDEWVEDDDLIGRIQRCRLCGTWTTLDEDGLCIDCEEDGDE